MPASGPPCGDSMLRNDTGEGLLPAWPGLKYLSTSCLKWLSAHRADWARFGEKTVMEEMLTVGPVLQVFFFGGGGGESPHPKKISCSPPQNINISRYP